MYVYICVPIYIYIYIVSLLLPHMNMTNKLII